MNKQEEEFEEFEEFEDGEDDDEDDNGTVIPEEEEVEEVQEEEEVQEVVEAPKPIKKKVMVKKTPVKTEVPETKTNPEPQIQYVGVPRAVTVEEMVNKVFDEVQELKQMVNALLTQNE